MLELIIVFFLARKVGRIAEEKGRGVWGYRFMAVGLWFGGEILGAMVGMAIHDDPATVYGLALIGAIVGAILSYVIVRNIAPAPMPYYDSGGYGPPPVQAQYPPQWNGNRPQGPPNPDPYAPQAFPQQDPYASQGYAYLYEQPSDVNAAQGQAPTPHANVIPVDEPQPMVAVPPLGAMGQARYEPPAGQRPGSFIQPPPPVFEDSGQTPLGQQPADTEPARQPGERPGKVSVNCPHCNNEFWLSAQWSGLFGRCPKCGKPVSISRQKNADEKTGITL